LLLILCYVAVEVSVVVDYVNTLLSFGYIRYYCSVFMLIIYTLYYIYIFKYIFGTISTLTISNIHPC
jgi:hypothetical protein